MVGMQTQFRPQAQTSAARTCESGGSCGGNKKAGLWTGSPYMSVFNIGNHYTYRMPQRQPTLLFSLTNTTRNPVQYKRNGYYTNPMM